MKKITILGSTGSIGLSALDVIEKNQQRFQVVALAAGKNINLLKKQIEKFKPEVVAVSTKESG
jgi:1-deoxy-D-xylulose-5-phosphate reductoisomerase